MSDKINSIKDLGAFMHNQSEEILINITPFETRVALISEGEVQELQVERAIQRGNVGDVHLGKVVRVLPGMQSAFVEIGLDRAAFIHVADLRENRLARTQGTVPTPIERLVFEGQTLMVQVIKDPIGSKGARLSTQISLAGRTLVYLPHDTHIGVSQKISPEEAREALQLRVAGLMPEGASGGFIVRTQAEDAPDDTLKSDIEYLVRLWGNIQTLAKTLPTPSVLYQDLNLAERVMRDMVTPKTNQILIDSRSATESLIKWTATYTPEVTERLKHYSGERHLFELANIEQEIKRALARRVDLKSGGYLVIDQTEALASIDVNTGGFVGGKNFHDTIFKTNLEAAQAIARQLRLRNLGGIIVVDFIDMSEISHQESVLGEFAKALSHDRTRTSMSGFSQLGLVELTRKRTREALASQLCEPCPTCDSRGQILTARSVCYEILREVLREAKQFNPREFRILASQTVVDLFLEEESQHLALLGDFIGKPITLEVANNGSQEQYDIVLM
jgi:ribonuclease G